MARPGAVILFSLAASAVPTLAHAACPQPVSTQALRDALGQVEASFSSQDLDGVRASVATARSSLPCLDGPLTTDDAAHVHRVEALAHFLDRDLDSTVAHYRSVLRLNPDYRLAGSIAPEGGPLRARFDEARQAPSPEMREVPAPTDGAVLIDGAQVAQAPQGLPMVFQQLDPRGAVRMTALLGVDDPLPTYDTARDLELAAAAKAAKGPEPVPLPAPDHKGRGRRVVLYTTAGVAAVGSAALLAGAAVQKSAYQDAAADSPGDDATYEQRLEHAKTLDVHIYRNLGYLRGAAGAGAMGLTLALAGSL